MRANHTLGEVGDDQAASMLPFPSRSASLRAEREEGVADATRRPVVSKEVADGDEVW